jgi:hypothetical protein
LKLSEDVNLRNISRTRDNEWLTENGDKVKDAEEKYLDDKL